MAKRRAIALHLPPQDIEIVHSIIGKILRAKFYPWVKSLEISISLQKYHQTFYGSDFNN
jgi:hypothetical protein